MSNKTQEKLVNRRHEQRLPLQGLELQIRKTGFNSSKNPFQTCRSVDLSQNGLAFASDSLDFKVPEKIDFILNLEEHQIKGTGVICNKRSTKSEIQYGLMFLSVTPEISSVFDYDELSTHELENLTANLAEQFVFSSIETATPIEKLTLRKQQQLFDACRSYLVRLGEMGVRMTEMQPDKKLLPGKAVKIFRTPEQSLLLRWHNSQTGHAEQLSIAIEQHSLNATFLVDNEKHCQNVLQVLEILGQKIRPHIQFI